MKAQALLKRVASSVSRRLRVAHEPTPPLFGSVDIDRLVQLHARTWAVEGSDWEPHRHAHLSLPEWFRKDMDPWSETYRQQQLKLWQLLAGVDRAYDPEVDEVEEPGWLGN